MLEIVELDLLSCYLVTQCFDCWDWVDSTSFWGNGVFEPSGTLLLCLCVSASIRHWLLRLKALLTGHYDKRDSVTELQWHLPFFYKSKVKENVSLAQITAEAMASCSAVLLVLETIYIPRQNMQIFWGGEICCIQNKRFNAVWFANDFPYLFKLELLLKIK